jgi:hypothetical protein
VRDFAFHAEFYELEVRRLWRSQRQRPQHFRFARRFVYLHQMAPIRSS